MTILLLQLISRTNGASFRTHDKSNKNCAFAINLLSNIPLLLGTLFATHLIILELWIFPNHFPVAISINFFTDFPIQIYCFRVNHSQNMVLLFGINCFRSFTKGSYPAISFFFISFSISRISGTSFINSIADSHLSYYIHFAYSMCNRTHIRFKCIHNKWQHFTFLFCNQ